MFDFSELGDDDDGPPPAAATTVGDDGKFYPGDLVKGHFQHANWYLATIEKANDDGTYTVKWDDGDSNDRVKPASDLKLVRRGAQVEDEEAANRCKAEAAREAEAAAAEQQRVEAERRAAEEAAAREAAERRAAEEAQRRAAEEASKREAEERRAEEERQAAAAAAAAAAQEAEAKAAAEAAAAAERQREEAEAAAEQSKAAEAKAKEAEAKAAAEAAAAAERQRKEAEEAAEQSKAAEAKAKAAEPAGSKEAADKEAPAASREAREVAEREAKKKNDADRKTRERRALVAASGRRPGCRVQLREMKDKPAMNGTFGTLLEQKGERWIVNLDGAPGVGKGRWMLNIKASIVAYWKMERPTTPYSIVGTWDNWAAPCELEWDEARICLRHVVTIGNRGMESFQFHVDGDANKCVYPDAKDANPHVPFKLRGPDAESHGLYWTVGRHHLDKGRKGNQYEVRLLLWEDQTVRAVEWNRLGDDGLPIQAEAEVSRPGKQTRYCIVGTWANWSVKDMEWDEKRSCFAYRVEIGAKGWESFQILVDGSYDKCLHPDRSDASMHMKYELCGPDKQGHGKNWTIGRHACDQGQKGDVYVVSLYLKEDGKPRLVEWERAKPDSEGATGAAAAAPQAAAEPGAAATGGPDAPAAAAPAVGAAKAAPSATPKPPRWCIVGSWNDWKGMADMIWDEARHLYTFKVKLGVAGQESFQLLLEGDYQRCLHPSRAHANPHETYSLCGPDALGHEKNWTIGRHPLDKGSCGASFEVRLRLGPDFQSEAVEWGRLTEEDADIDEVD